MTHSIRPYKAEDLPRLHTINCASEPGVGAVSEDKLTHLIEAGHCIIAEDDAGHVVGFILLHRPGAAYDGWNFSWFKARYESFIYVDRIAVSPEARGQKIGEALYAGAFETFSDDALLIGCEVNSAPPNPGSMRFHQRLGFKPVGEHVFSDDYAVTYLARRLG